ncbi:hypothetical protein BJX99DRAFT_227079 [Aspergillus californicus]
MVTKLPKTIGKWKDLVQEESLIGRSIHEIPLESASKFPLSMFLPLRVALETRKTQHFQS